LNPPVTVLEIVILPFAVRFNPPEIAPDVPMCADAPVVVKCRPPVKVEVPISIAPVLLT
jgi:hypothetical protein